MEILYYLDEIVHGTVANKTVTIQRTIHKITFFLQAIREPTSIHLITILQLDNFV